MKPSARKGKKYCESYPRVMKYFRKRRPMKLIKKIEKDLAELKELLGNP